MTTAFDMDVYRRARADGQRARDALRLARWIKQPRLDIEPFDGSTTIERDGFDITITTRADEYVDLEDLGYGTFEDGTEDWRTGYYHADTPGAIPNPARDYRSGGGGMRFYVPAEPRAERVKYARQHGASKSVAWDLALAYEQEELKAATQDWGPTVVVLTVTVSREGIELASNSVGGIEIAWSDITRTDGSEYLAEVAEDLIPETIAEAMEALERLVRA